MATVNQNLAAFLISVDNRASILVDQLDGLQLTLEDVQGRVSHSVMNVFEERCGHTHRRKAVWMYNRETGKAEASFVSSRGLK